MVVDFQGIIRDFDKWMFPKIGVFPPKSSILIGFSILFTIHFGGKSPYFWKHPNQNKSCVFVGQMSSLMSPYGLWNGALASLRCSRSLEKEACRHAQEAQRYVPWEQEALLGEFSGVLLGILLPRYTWISLFWWYFGPDSNLLSQITLLWCASIFFKSEWFIDFVRIIFCCMIYKSSYSTCWT